MLTQNKDLGPPFLPAVDIRSLSSLRSCKPTLFLFPIFHFSQTLSVEAGDRPIDRFQGVLKMAANEKRDNASTRGNDWEVVSLTASMYAAAPGPKAFDSSVESKDEINKEELVDSAAMLMSNHYKYLMIEPDCSETHYEPASQVVNHAEELHGAIKSDNDNWKLKSDDGLHGLQFFDKEKNLSDGGMEFGEGKVVEELTIVGEEPDIYDDPTFSSLRARSAINQSVICSKGSEHVEFNLSHHNPENPSDGTNAAKLNEESKIDGPGLPCEAWWKRHAMSLYNHAKEANAFWSVFVAAAVVGFVILGQQWQREKTQVQHLEWFTTSDELHSLDPVHKVS